MKKIILRKEKKNYTTELNEEKLKELQEKIKSLYIYYEDVVESIDDLNHMELLEEYADDLGITSEVRELQEYHKDFDEFINIMFENDPIGAANAAHFGNYNPMDDYIHLDGYGNLETISETRLEKKIDELFEEHKTKIIEKAIEDEKTPEAEQWAELIAFRAELVKPYKIAREKRQNNFNDEPLGFAFSDKQFKEMMKKWGLDPEKDLNKIISIGCGGFMQKKDVKAFETRQHTQRKIEKIQFNNISFLAGALFYEMSNHEAIYNYQLDFDLENCFNFSKKFWEKITSFYNTILQTEKNIEYMYN